MSSWDYLYKLIIIGEVSTGKSCITLRFTDEQFNSSSIPTIGVDFKSKYLKLNNKKTLKLQLWDTGGSERFRSVRKPFYRGAQGVLLVYDITDRQSFEALDYWMNEIRQYSDENIEIILIGNKIDQFENREISTEEGANKARKLGLKFMETSAKYNENISKAILTLVEDIMNKQNLNPNGESEISRNITQFKLADDENASKYVAQKCRLC